MNEPKDILRREARRHRSRMDPAAEDVEAASGVFFGAVPLAGGEIIAAYWPAGREFDPHFILEEALRRGHVCALPVIREGSLELGFARWEESMDLMKGPFGIMQPVTNADTAWLEPDVVLVPLLAFDRRGYRLGQGGGYYDATLRALRNRKGIVAVGLGYAQQACLFNLPVESHDERLDWVITPQGSHYFGPDTPDTEEG